MKGPLNLTDKPILLMVTTATRDEAENLGEALLRAGLARRGSVIPVIHSFWLGIKPNLVPSTRRSSRAASAPVRMSIKWPRISTPLTGNV